jgi:hypothetical protein
LSDDGQFGLMDRGRTIELLGEVNGLDGPMFTSTADERYRFAALKISDGEISNLEIPVKLYARDASDPLETAGPFRPIWPYKFVEPQLACSGAERACEGHQRCG